MRAVKITDTGWVQSINIEPEELARTLGSPAVAELALRHNITVWHWTDSVGMPNATAMLLLAWAGDSAAAVPLITGDAILLGRSPFGDPTDLLSSQLHTLGHALLMGLAA